MLTAEQLQSIKDKVAALVAAKTDADGATAAANTADAASKAADAASVAAKLDEAAADAVLAADLHDLVAFVDSLGA